MTFPVLGKKQKFRPKPKNDKKQSKTAARKGKARFTASWQVKPIVQQNVKLTSTM